MNAKEIKERRLIMGLTQKQLAERIGVDPATIFNYEKGRTIPKNKILILRQALGVKEEPEKIKESINDRIKYLLYHYKTDARGFSRQIGLTNYNTIHNIIHDHSNPSYTTLQKILMACPEINPGWLLDGYAQMLKGNIDASINFDDLMNAKMKESLKRLQDQIDMINDKIDDLIGAKIKDQLKRLQDQLDMIKEKIKE